MSTFTIRNIKMDPTDPASIQRAIRQVNDVEKRLQPAMEELVRRMAEKGVGIAKAEIIFFDDPAYDTGALQESIRAVVNGNEATIAAGYENGPGYYAAYVEFGTGMPGLTSAKNPSMRDPDRKDTGTYSEVGWVYYNEQIDSFVFTTGMAGRPFMHNTYEDLIEEAEVAGGRIVAEYLAEGV